MDKILLLGCLTLITIASIKCSIVRTDTILDDDLTIDLVADEVKEKTPKSSKANANKPGMYISFLTKFGGL